MKAPAGGDWRTDGFIVGVGINTGLAANIVEDSPAGSGGGFLWGEYGSKNFRCTRKDGTGNRGRTAQIQLESKRNSTMVVKHTLASENPDEAGRYSMDVEYGQYSVILLVEGFPPSHAGTITVYEDSRPGTLNDFRCHDGG